MVSRLFVLPLLALTLACSSAWAADSSAIVPHRAVYEMALGSVKNGSTVAAVSGKMLYEWNDTCDGWAVQQHLQLHFNYAEGATTDAASSVLTWESKDGQRYKFNVRRLTDGKETERFRGQASLAGDKATATYAEPKAETLPMPHDTLFPTAHTLHILRSAANGEKFFTRTVFDGSDEEGLANVSAFIGTKQDKVDTTLKSPLLQGPAWPVRMAFFKMKSETGEPEYEMNLMLLPNGVAQSMQIDYGDFSVTGKLVHIEPLPPSGC